MKTNKGSFIFSIIVLIAGMTAGFVLLAMIYTGPRWISFIVFLVYIFIMYFIVLTSKRYLKALDEANKNKDQK